MLPEPVMNQAFAEYEFTTVERMDTITVAHTMAWTLIRKVQMIPAPMRIFFTISRRRNKSDRPTAKSR